MTIDDRSPCIIGVARRTWRTELDEAPEPLDMWTQVSRAAAEDAKSTTLVEKIDAIHVVHCMSWAYDDPARRLADALGIEPGFSEVSVLAGTAGQRMVNSAAERMLAGDSELALVVGGEALATRRRLKADGRPLSWSFPSPDQDKPPIDLDEWIAPTEWAHDVLQPTVTFALLDTARRARRGESVEHARRGACELLSSMSAVAAANPEAWFQRFHEPAELDRVTTENRVISAPYSKHMVAIMDVDMAAGVIMATHKRANELGIDPDQRVYLRSWGFGRDATHLAARPWLDRSDAMAQVGGEVLSRAGIGLDEITQFDLYSCFASSVQFALDALGLEQSDPRGVTVTGGLPYHGGPSSNYTTHSIATIVERLRSEGDGFGFVTGVGMHMTKHVAALYSPEPGPLQPPDYAATQRAIDQTPLVPITPVVSHVQEARIAAYTWGADRSGAPSTALAICELPDGSRCYARSFDPKVLECLRVGEWVGRSVDLVPGENGVNLLRVVE